MAKVSYYSNDPMFSDKDAAAVGRFLARKFKDTEYSAEDVLEAARSRSSPIHKYFEWNDKKAAEKFRLAQAGKLIRAVCLVDEDTGYDGRAVLYSGTKGGGFYMDREKALSSPDIANQIIENAWNELKGWKTRYEQYKEFSLVIRSINQTEEKLNGSKEKSKKGSKKVARKKGKVSSKRKGAKTNRSRKG